MKISTRSILIVLTVIASLVLAACGSAASSAPTEAPVAQAPAATEAPAATVAPTEKPLSGTISVSGAFALYPMMTVWADEFTKLHPEVQFDVQGGGAGKGMTDTIAGAVDIGMISRSIKPEEEAQDVFWVSVTKDAVFPVLSDKNPVAAEILAKGISQESFNKIFITGEIKTWVKWSESPKLPTKSMFTAVRMPAAREKCGPSSRVARFKMTSMGSVSMANRPWSIPCSRIRSELVTAT